MLFGPEDLWESNIIKEISFLAVGVKKKVFVFVLDRKSLHCTDFARGLKQYLARPQLRQYFPVQIQKNSYHCCVIMKRTYKYIPKALLNDLRAGKLQK